MDREYSEESEDSDDAEFGEDVEDESDQPRPQYEIQRLPWSKNYLLTINKMKQHWNPIFTCCDDAFVDTFFRCVHGGPYLNPKHIILSYSI